MQITDRNRISEPLRLAVERALNDYLGYGAGWANVMSVTSVIQPIKITLLTRRHDWELTADLTEVVELFIGQMAHLYLKDTGLTDVKQYEAVLTDANGRDWTIGGTPDYVTHGPGGGLLVQDFKITKAWAIRGRVNEEWQKQQDIYRWLLARNGLDQTAYRGELVALVKDWNHYKAGSKDYPPGSVTVVPLKLAEPEETERWLRERMAEYGRAQSTGKIPDCTDGENWGGKRCARCFVRPWCAQGQALVRGKEPDLDLE